MLNEKYIFWETEIDIEIGKGVHLRGGLSEWCDPDSQINQYVAIVSEEGFTDEQVRQIGHEIGGMPYVSGDEHYIGMHIAHTSSMDIFQALYNLGQRFAKIFIDTSFRGEKFIPKKYYLRHEVVRTPHVWRHPNLKEDKVELLTREQYKSSSLENEYLIGWQPLSLSAVLRDDFKKLPEDLFLPDRNEYT